MCSAPRLIKLYICVKFHQNIWNGFQLTERTQVHRRKKRLFSISTMFKGLQLHKQVNQRYVFCALHVVSWCLSFVRSFIKISGIKISGTVFKLYLQSRHKYMIEMAMFNVQRAITPNKGKPELLFISSACCLEVLYICVKFPENISGTVFNLQSRHEYMVEMAMFTVQRAITPEVGKQS